MIGMHRTPREQLQEILSLSESVNEIDMQDAIRRKKQVAQEFRDQLVCGAPTNEDEVGLQRLSQQIKSGMMAIVLLLGAALEDFEAVLLDRGMEATDDGNAFIPQHLGEVVGFEDEIAGALDGAEEGDRQR